MKLRTINLACIFTLLPGMAWASVTCTTPAGTLDQALQTVLAADNARTQLVWNSKNAQTVRVGQHKFNNAAMKEVLTVLLKDTPFTYQVTPKGVYTVVATKGGTTPAVKGTVKGIVLDAEGEPVIGATVIVKGTQYGVATDLDGAFTLIDLTQTNPTLLISCIGYLPQEKKVALGSDNTFILEENAQLLGEVLVTGYQELSRERATGSFSKISSADLEGKRISSISSLLDGQVAGVVGDKIRGVTSMNGVTTPLYVIDGFPVEKTVNDGYGNWTEETPDINVEDIESITVLKDAAAASIYGARAANGVIVITTKKAQKDTQQIYASTTLSVQPYSYKSAHWADAATLVGLEQEWAAMNPKLKGDDAGTYAQNLLDNASYSTAATKAILNRYAGNLNQVELDTKLAQLAGQSYNYYHQAEELAKKNTFMQQYNLSVNKGAGRNNFSASFSYRHNQLEDKYTHNQQFGINIKNVAEITNWLTFDCGAYLNYANGQQQTFDVFSPGYTVMPYDSLTNPDGTPWTYTQEQRYSKSDLATLNDHNLNRMDVTPLDEMGMNLIKNRDFSTRLYGRLQFKFTNWLRYTASFQYEAGEYKTEQFREQESYYVRNLVNTFASQGADGETVWNMPNGNINYEMANTLRGYNFRQQIDVNYSFNDNNELTAILGQEIRENKTNTSTSTLYGYDPDMLSFEMIDANNLTGISGLWGWGSFTTQDFAKRMELKNRFVSFYANASYLFMQRYMLSGSIRWDKTNLFGTGSKFQKKPIWSVGAGWNINKEEFFPKLPWVNMLKLRGSYGIGGNIAKNSAPYMTANYKPNTHVGGLSGTISSRPNPDLRWEKTTTANVGIEFALLNNRLTGAVDYYFKRGVDLLANTNGVPTEGWGFSTYTINNGKMTNQGIEVTLNSTPFKTRDWTWNLGAVFSYNKNKVTYVNVEAPVAVLQLDYPESYPRIGNPYNSIYGYEWAGLSADGLPQVYDSEGNICSTSEPSGLESLVYLGTTVPTTMAALNTTVRYRDFELTMQCTYEGGAKMRNTFAPFFNTVGPVNASIADRWQKPGDELTTDIPRFVSTESELYNWSMASLYKNSSACVVSANNFRLSNLSLTYHLPQNICKKMYLNNARLMLGIEDLFMIAANKDAKYLMGGYNNPTYVMALNLNF